MRRTFDTSYAKRNTPRAFSKSPIGAPVPAGVFRRTTVDERLRDVDVDVERDVVVAHTPRGAFVAEDIAEDIARAMMMMMLTTIDVVGGATSIDEWVTDEGLEMSRDSS